MSYGGQQNLPALKRSTEVVEHRAGGGSPPPRHKSPGRSKFGRSHTGPRGSTQDMAFHDWAGLVWKLRLPRLGSEVSPGELS